MEKYRPRASGGSVNQAADRLRRDAVHNRLLSSSYETPKSLEAHFDSQLLLPPGILEKWLNLRQMLE